jgi:TfoX/Sxy family transcriptional regulator of competence genes
MPYDEALTARIREIISERADITERKMFGGVAFLCSGRMCCGVAGNDLVVRVVESEMARALARPHVRPMDLTGRPLRGFVFVSPGGCRTNQALKKWIEDGLRFVQENYATGGPKRQSRNSPSRAGVPLRGAKRPRQVRTRKGP